MKENIGKIFIEIDWLVIQIDKFIKYVDITF